MTDRNSEKPTTVPWERTCDRFVAFLDVMGFKEWLYRNDHEVVVESMGDSIGLASRGLDLHVGLFQEPVVRAVVFSDSTLLVTRDGSFDSIEALLYRTICLITSAAIKGIPLKGAIAYGKQTADFCQSLHVGIPLIDAYELQNDLQMYGAVLHHSAERHLTKQKWITKLRGLRKYPTPVRSGSVTHYALEFWPLEEYSVIDSLGLKNISSNFYCNVSGSTRRYVDNTTQFWSWLIDQYEPPDDGKPGNS